MIVFQQNKAFQAGGAIESHVNNILLFIGTVVLLIIQHLMVEQ